MEQLKSLCEICNRFSSLWATNIAFILMLSWRFSTFRISSMRVIPMVGSGVGTTCFPIKPSRAEYALRFFYA